MSRFTLRELFWLTLVVGLALGWWLDHRWLTLRVASLRAELPLCLPFDAPNMCLHLVLWIVLICGLLEALRRLVHAAVEIATSPELNERA